MKFFLVSVSFFFLLSSCLSKTNLAQPENNQKPNIVFVYADDWGWGDLTSHGSTFVKTPNLDRLAEEGADFYNFNVLNPVCSPSRVALLTGQYPARYSIHQHFALHTQNQANGMPDWLDPNAPTLPRMLQQAGYLTAHYGKWHLTNSDAIAEAPNPKLYGYNDYAGWNGPKPNISQRDVFERTLDFLANATKQGKPAFVNLWMHETHTPHKPSVASLSHYANLSEAQKVYAAVVEDGDVGIGKLLDGLERMGLSKNTIIIFSSDNGPEITGAQKQLGDGLGTFYSVGETGGLKGRKRSLYEGGVRVPFIVRWPGKVPANYIDKTSLITAVDMLPTICNIAGAKIPVNYLGDGEDKLSVLLGKPEQHQKPVYWEWKGFAGGENWPRLAIHDKDWKLLINDKGKKELYNFKNDDKEKIDVSSKNKGIVDELTKKLMDWKATLPTKPDPNYIMK